MTKEAFAILTSSVNITTHDPSLPRHHASSTTKFAGQSIDEGNTGSKNDGEAKETSLERPPAAVPMSPSYAHLQRLKLVFHQIDRKALAFHEWSLGKFSALEHLDLWIGWASPAITCGLLRVVLWLQRLKSLRLCGLSLSTTISARAQNRTAKKKERKKKQKEVQALVSLFAEALAGGEWAARLSMLTFQGCNLTDDFLERVFIPRALAGCPQLSTVNLTKNPYNTEVGYAALVRALSAVKHTGLCPYLLTVAVGPEAADPEWGGIDDDEDKDDYGYLHGEWDCGNHTQEICFERVKSAIH